MIKLTSLTGIASLTAVCVLFFGCPTSSKPGAPSISAVAPTDAVNNVNTSITITGSGYLNGLTVAIGGQGAVVNSVGSTQIVATVVAGIAAGKYDVTVTNIDGQKATLTQAITVKNPAPVVSGVTPSTGVNNGTTSLTVLGTGFLSGASVNVGSTPCTVNLVGSTSISAVVPAGIAEGTYNVTVTNSDSQSGSLANAFTVRNPAPTVSGINPTTGRQTLTTGVTISGNYFQTGATVSIGATACGSVSVGSSTSITCTVPSGMSAGIYSITVTNTDSQSGTLPNAFTVVAPPTVVSVTPNVGSTTITTTVTIGGTGFQNSASVQIGAFGCGSVTVISSTILCAAPVMAAGTYNVTVTNPDTQAGSLTNAFTVYNPPTVSSATPSPIANNQNNTMTISGSNFRAGALAAFVGPGTYNLLVNSVAAGSINATALAGIPAGTYNVRVTNTDGQSGIGGSVQVRNPAPQVTGITPTFGLLGTPVTITGVNFAAGATATIGGVACTGVVVTPPTTIGCAVGSLGPGTYSVVVTNNTDSQSGTLSNAFTVNPAPTVTSIFPTSGPNNSPTPVAIAGTGFLSGATVTMGSGGSTATLQGVVVNGSTSISAVVPTGVTPGSYTIYVNNPDGRRGACACTFSVFQGPRITSLSPGTGNVNSLVTINGTNFGSSQGASTVTFNGIQASVYSWSDSQIQAYVPTEASCGPVIVTVGGVDSNPASFSVVPQITSISPRFASVFNRIAVRGYGFNTSPPLNQVSMNGTGASVSYSTSNLLISNEPIAAVGISVAVQITNTACNTSSNLFTFGTVPTLTVSLYAAGGYGLWDLVSAGGGGGSGGYVSSKQNNAVLRAIDDPSVANRTDFIALNIPQLNAPEGLAVDSFGNLFVANSATSGPYANSIIKAVTETTTGLVVTSVQFATGFNQPQDLALGPNNTLYVANTGANAVSWVNAGGTVTASWGTGLSLPTGVSASPKYVWVTNAGNNTVSKIDANLGGAPVTSFGGFVTPTGIFVNGPECTAYVSNSGNNTISKVFPGGLRYTYANSAQGLAQPMGLGGDENGDLFVANGSTAGGQMSSNSVEILAKNPGQFFTLNSTNLFCASDMAVDIRGNVFVLVNDGCFGPPYPDIQMFPAGGGGPIGLPITGVNNAQGIAIDNAYPPNIYISYRDTSGAGCWASNTCSVAKYTLWGAAISQFTTGYNSPRGMDINPQNGNLYVADPNLGLFEVPPGGGPGSPVPVGTGCGCQMAAAYNRVNGLVYLVDCCSYMKNVDPVAGGSTLITYFGDFTEKLSSDECGNIWAGKYRYSPTAGVSNYLGVSSSWSNPIKTLITTTTSAGLIWLDANPWPNEIRSVNYTASFWTYIRGAVENPQGLAFDTKGDLFVANDSSIASNDSIGKIEPFVPLSYTHTTSAQINVPKGLAFSSNGDLYVANNGTKNILKVTPVGAVSEYLPAVFNSPVGLTFSNGGNFPLFISDGVNGMLMVDSGGSVSIQNQWWPPYSYIAIGHQSGYNALFWGMPSNPNYEVVDWLWTPGWEGINATWAGPGNVQGVAVHPQDTYIYYAKQAATNTLRRAMVEWPYTQDTIVKNVAGGLMNLSNPQGVAIDPLTWSIFVANAGNNTIYMVNP